MEGGNEEESMKPSIILLIFALVLSLLLNAVLYGIVQWDKGYQVCVNQKAYHAVDEIGKKGGGEVK